MSLVMATSSYLAAIFLQSISSSVVFPEPTGPPTPTRSGGSVFVRRVAGLVFLICIIERPFRSGRDGNTGVHAGKTRWQTAATGCKCAAAGRRHCPAHAHLR